MLQGTHRVIDGEFDLTLIRRIPIDPEKLSVNLTLFEYVPDERNHRNLIKRQLICLNAVVTITLTKSSNATRNARPSNRRNGARLMN